MPRGADPVTATQRAYAALFGMVQRQASMVSFVELFRLLGMIFLLLLPLVLLMKRPRGRRAAIGGALTRSLHGACASALNALKHLRIAEVRVAAARDSGARRRVRHGCGAGCEAQTNRRGPASVAELLWPSAPIERHADEREDCGRYSPQLALRESASLQRYSGGRRSSIPGLGRAISW